MGAFSSAFSSAFDVGTPAFSLVASTTIPATGSSNTVPQTSSAIDTTGVELIEITVSSSTGAIPPDLSDSKSNTWTGLTVRSFGNSRVRKFYLIGGTVGSGHTFTLTPVDDAYATAIVRAYSAGGTVTFIGESGAGSVLGTSQASGALSVVAGDLLTSGLTYDRTITGLGVSGGGLSVAQHTAYAAGSGMGCAAADVISGSTASVDPTWSWGTSADSSVASALYRDSGGAGGEVAGTLSQTLGAVTLSATSTVDLVATLSQSLDAATLASTGEVADPAITGEAILLLGALDLAFSGTVDIQGEVDQILGSVDLVGRIGGANALLIMP